jgi:Ca2+-binding RTX toxin-like protein
MLLSKRTAVRVPVALAAAALVTVVLAVVASSAGAVGEGPSCSYDAAHHRLDVVVVSGGIHKAPHIGPGGGPVTLSVQSGAIKLDGASCGPATVTNTDLIRADQQSSGTELDIDLSGGPFAPGFTGEPGKSDEIEWKLLNFVGGRLGVTGSSGKDVVLAGDDGIDLNGAESLKDVDVTGGGVFAMSLALGSGADVVSGAGSGVAGSGPTPMSLFVESGPGDDSVTGGIGNDALAGGTVPDGADTFVGAGGKDSVEYSSRSAGVHVSTDGVANDGEPGEGDDIEPGVENVSTGAFADHLQGSDRNETFQDGGGDNTFAGGAGNDLFILRADGTDVVHGGDGRDTVSYFTQGDVTTSLDGVANDGVNGLSNVFGDVEVLLGGDGDDTLTGSDARNRLDRGPGNDTLFGLGGKDVLVDSGREVNGSVTNDGDDTFSGGAGVDTVNFSFHATPLVITIDGVKNDTSDGGGNGTNNVGTDVENVVGGSGDDHITGDGDANLLKGGGGADDLFGLGGDDRLRGGDGDDDLTGGQGFDRCKQGAGSGTVDCEA